MSEKSESVANLEVLRFVRDCPDRSAYCLEGVTGADIANHFEELCGASWEQCMDVVAALQTAGLLGANIMVDTYWLTKDGKSALDRGFLP